MRWFEKDIPVIGETDVKIKFLWVPLTIKGETRWLEKSTILYKFMEVEDGFDMLGHTLYKLKWVPIEFINK